MRLIEVSISALAGVAGSWAAWCWYKASSLIIDPGIGYDSGDIHTQDMAWLGATMENIRMNSNLNRRAAAWTAWTQSKGRYAKTHGLSNGFGA